MSTNPYNSPCYGNTSCNPPLVCVPVRKGNLCIKGGFAHAHMVGIPVSGDTAP